MEFTFSKAVRKAAPMLISISGTSGSGKTFSALLLAAGLAGPDGKVGFLDTENGRGSMYADSPGIVAALPNGFAISQMDAPFTPARYTEAIQVAEKAGITVLVIDSGTHEWEGIGGCNDIAENNKLRGMPNWSMAKREHKRFVNHCLSSTMHIIFCLRARDKVKIAKDDKGKEQVIPIGIQPIAEKNFVFEMLLSLQLDEKTHYADPVKVPEPLKHLFAGSKLVTKSDGEHIRQWNSKAAIPMDAADQLQKRARAAAEDGLKPYGAFFASLTAAQKKNLIDGGYHAANKAAAHAVDVAAESEDREFLPEPHEGHQPGARVTVNGLKYAMDEECQWRPEK